jgi:hypothetical protein
LIPWIADTSQKVLGHHAHEKNTAPPLTMEQAMSKG